MTPGPQHLAGDDSAASNEVIDLIGGRLELVARMGAGDSDTVLFRTRMAPGGAVPLHSHIDPECFYVLAGAVEMFLVDERPHWRRVSAGHSLLAADGISHAIRNPGDEPADLIVATNGRLARFFREAGRPVEAGATFAPPTPEDLARFRRVADVYGYQLTTPAESAAITDAARP